ncbi:MAG: hypothetical protein HY657_16690 [Acidobacteria bacterium]|nr:hypothetical protein [Acidobacteriota bacterium]
MGEVQEPNATSTDDARRVRDQYMSVRNEARTGIELYSSRSPVPADAPVYVFQHTMKTGGTAVRALIYSNLSASAAYEAHDAPKSAKHGGLAAWYRDFVERVNPAERSRLLWAVGHTAVHIAPFLGRPARIVSVVREPVDRVVSRHWFAGRLTTTGVRTELIEKLWQIYESPQTVGRRWHLGYSNFQSQSILAPYYDVTTLPVSKGPSADADLWRTRLLELVEKSCVLLVQDRLDEGTRWFGAQQQWRVTALPKIRVNRGRPAVSDLDPDLRAVIGDYNWLDTELYAHAVRRHERREAAASR